MQLLYSKSPAEWTAKKVYSLSYFYCLKGKKIRIKKCDEYVCEREERETDRETERQRKKEMYVPFLWISLLYQCGKYTWIIDLIYVRMTRRCMH